MSKSQTAWERWKALAATAATFQARILLGAFFWVVVTPFAIVLRLCSDPLKLHDDSQGGQWEPCPKSNPREQF